MSTFPGIVVRAVALTLSASAAWSATSQAQRDAPLQTGARISVSVVDSSCRRPWRSCAVGDGVLGTLVRATPDTLVVRVSEWTTLPIARMAGQRVFVSAGTSRLRSALRSAVQVGLTTALLVAQTNASRQSAIRTTAGFAGGGLVLGALLPRERWRKVSP